MKSWFCSEASPIQEQTISLVSWRQGCYRSSLRLYRKVQPWFAHPWKKIRTEEATIQALVAPTSELAAQSQEELFRFNVVESQSPSSILWIKHWKQIMPKSVPISCGNPGRLDLIKTQGLEIIGNFILTADECLTWASCKYTSVYEFPCTWEPSNFCFSQQICADAIKPVFSLKAPEHAKIAAKELTTELRTSTISVLRNKNLTPSDSSHGCGTTRTRYCIGRTKTPCGWIDSCLKIRGFVQKGPWRPRPKQMSSCPSWL